MSSATLYNLLFLGIFVGLISGIIALQIYTDTKRRERWQHKTPADYYSDMCRDLRQWGYILIVFNGLALLGSLPANDPFVVAQSIASFIAALLVAYLFITVADAVLFLAYALVLVFYTLIEALGMGLLVLPFAILRTIWVLFFIRQFLKYRKHQAAYHEGRGFTTAQTRDNTGVSQKLTRIIILTGVASGVGLASLLVFGFLYALATAGTLDLPLGIIALEWVLLLLGVVAAALTIAVRVEGMDSSGFATVSGILGGLAVLAVLALSVPA